MSTPTPNPSNPLVDLIPATKRKTVYAVFALVGLFLGAVVVAFTALGNELPEWAIASGAVYTFLGVPFGALAASNVGNPS